MTPQRPSAYAVAVERRKRAARTARAADLTPVAVAWCLHNDRSADQLAEEPEATWAHLAFLISMERYPSPATRAIVVENVTGLLPHPCPRCRRPVAGQGECTPCTFARLTVHDGGPEYRLVQL